MKIYKDFTFEAAHYLPGAPPGHPNSRVHGHSFRARIWVAGEPDPTSGLIFHFDDLSEAIGEAREALDHRFLNDVEGLETPTLERITVWLWNRLSNRLPGLSRIEVSRDSCHEGCVYDGPGSADARLAAE
ncbi:MAG: 6-carboxytetrahydropterin synthase [Alphaproteobacteria bacterium]|nr:6-carboxytetrahydropterin synthase [Alphaproteobacteria bacterium]